MRDVRIKVNDRKRFRVNSIFENRLSTQAMRSRWLLQIFIAKPMDDVGRGALE